MAQLISCNEIYRRKTFEYVNIVSFGDLFLQGCGYFLACCVRGMDDPTVAVATFLGQVKFLMTVSIGLGVEFHAKIHQPRYDSSAIFYGISHDVGVAEAAAGVQGIFNVGFDTVVFVQYCCNAALGVVG